MSLCVGSARLNRLLTRTTSVQSVRSYWWGHDTIEDKNARDQEKRAKDVISWTPPVGDLAEKKEFIWAPARIEQESSLSAREKEFPKFKDANQMFAYFSKRYSKTWAAVFMPEKIMEENRNHDYSILVENQHFIQDRLLLLGPDLAAAHFLCHANCRVRFRGHQHWTELDRNGNLDIPATYVKGWYIEAIDACTASLVYEGLQNLRNLHFLKHLDISYCEHIDEWSMDRISGEYADSLEYLNISGCRKLNWNGLEVLWRFKNLKTLVIKDMEHVEDLTLICLLLLDVLPKLKIVGAEYLDLKLLEGSPHYDHLLQDDYLPLLNEGDSVDDQKSAGGVDSPATSHTKVEAMPEKQMKSEA